MRDHVDELIKIMPPPAKPLWSEGDWAEIEARLGLTFPSDYRRYIAAYGAGGISSNVCFVGYLTVVSPFEPAEDGSRLLPKYSAILVEQLKSYFEDGMFDTRPLLYPEPGGFFPVASTGDHHYIGWKTAGEPDDWDVMVFTTNLFKFDELPGTSLSKLFLDLLGHTSPVFEEMNIMAPENFATRAFFPRELNSGTA